MISGVMREAERMRQVQTPIIPVVADWIRQNPGTISLGQGVVGYGPPPEASVRLQQFFADPANHKYKPVTGLPELVNAFSIKFQNENQIPIADDSAVVVTAGGNMAFMNALLAITNPGDEVILQTPYYFNHEMAITMASCRPILVGTDENYQLQPELIRRAITPRTRAVVTVSPNNPSGAVYPESVLREVNEICRNQGVFHIHDEAYEYFVYGGARHFSPGSIPGAAAHTISLFSLSKAYGFASWRIGCMVIPQALLAAVRKIQDTILICAPVISQFAALGALEAGRAYCEAHLSRLRETRTMVLQALGELQENCTVPPAEGAFYFLLRLNTERSSLEVTERLIRGHKVAVIPGTAFGLERGCYLRLAYGALEPSTALDGMGRLVSGLKTILRS